MRMRIPLVAVLALFVAVSCDQQLVQLEADEAAVEIPALNYMNGPEDAGKSGVSRLYYEDCWWCGSTDPVEDLLATHYQGDDIFFCGGGSDFIAWETQLVENKSGEFYKNQAYDEPIFIYDRTDFFAACTSQEACCTFRAENWLYKGTHDMVAVDNWQAHRFSMQMTGHGTVYDHLGNEYQYRERQKNTSDNGWTHETITVKLK